MNREHLRIQIQQAADHFTDQVVSYFGEALATLAQDLSLELQLASLGTPAAATVRAKRTSSRQARALRSNKPGRRSARELNSVANRVVELLQSREQGMRIEEINRALGTSTRELMRPIRTLLANSQIRKTGQRRSTTYFAC